MTCGSLRVVPARATGAQRSVQQWQPIPRQAGWGQRDECESPLTPGRSRTGLDASGVCAPEDSRGQRLEVSHVVVDLRGHAGKQLLAPGVNLYFDAILEEQCVAQARSGVS